MSNIKRRIEKVEDKVQSMEKEANDRKAKLLEIQRLGKDDSLRALLLKLELEHGRTFSLVDVIAMAAVEQTKDSRRV